MGVYSQRYPEGLLGWLNGAASNLLSPSIFQSCFPVSSEGFGKVPGPQTLLTLLSQTASRFPDSGLELYDNGLDNPPTLLKYADLYSQAKV